MAIILLVAEGFVTQGDEDVNTAFTWSLLFRVLLLKLFPVCPVLLLFKNHWYVGAVPPLTGEAVNVTLVPEQIFV
jgi:hypothetical protein